ncbi:MAG: hypothetical protein LBG81_07010 [Coriobacteriaceae bacterium]|nr:hypothetical protein [Coriobacteriaceae bacterium]
MQFSWLGVAVMGGLLIIGLAASAILSKDKDQKKAVVAAFVALILLWGLFYFVVIQSAQSAAFPYFVIACLVVPIGLYALVMAVIGKKPAASKSGKRKKDALELPYGAPKASMQAAAHHMKSPASSQAPRVSQPAPLAEGFRPIGTAEGQGGPVAQKPFATPLAQEPFEAPEAVQVPAAPKRAAGSMPAASKGRADEVAAAREGRLPSERPARGVHAAVPEPAPAPEAAPAPRHTRRHGLQPVRVPEQELVPQQATAPEPEPAPRPVSRPEPAPKPEPRPVPVLEPEAGPVSRLEPAYEAEPAPRPRPVPKAEPEPVPAVAAAPKPEPKPEPKPVPEPKPAAAASVGFEACYAKAEAFKDKSLWAVSARLFEESAYLTEELPLIHKAVFAAISSYLKADMSADAQRLASALQESGTLNQVEAMKVAAVLKMS